MREIWAKIKCLFGKCAELEEIKIKEKLAVDSTYKVEPTTIKVTKPSTKKTKVTKPSTKPKRSYVCKKGVPSKLVLVSEVPTYLENGWSKGRKIKATKNGK